MPQLNLLAQSVQELTVINSDTSTTITQPQQQEKLEFSTLVGQSTASYLLSGAIDADRVAPAYLFGGVDGIGKTLAARIFTTKLLGAQAIGNHPDLAWVEPTYLHQGQLVNWSELADVEVKRKYPPQIRIEQIRKVMQFLSCSPLVAPGKVVIITNAHCMAQAAANALLKTLEEPINGTIILISSQPQKLLPTISSRCQVVPFQRLNHSEMMLVLEKLGRTDVLNDSTVMSLAAGSPGQAIAHYEQLQSTPQALLAKLAQIPSNALAAMQTAKEIDEKLEYHQQLWLLDYLQHSWWHRYQDVSLANRVEEAKTALNKTAASRLVWEVLLLPTN